MKQHILGILLAVSFANTATAEDVRLTLERPIEFKTLDDCQEAAETLELMYRRYDIKPLAICEADETTNGAEAGHLPPAPEDGELSSPMMPPSSPPHSEPLPWEREA